MYVTGVGHTSLSSASIRSGEIIIPIKCGTKGYPSPILDSARVHCAHLAREESAHRAPQRWAFDDLSPLHMQALRQGRVSRPVSKGMHAGHKSEMGAGQVSGYVSQVWEEVWEVSGADAAAAAAGRLPRSGFDIVAGARFVLQRGGGAVRSGPVAGGAA